MTRLKKSKEVKIISGVSFQPNTHDLVALLWLFLYARILQDDPVWRPEGWFDANPEPYTGAGRFEHAKLFAQIVWPKGFEWHDWSERDVQSFCEYAQTAISGGAGTGKSSDAAMYGLEYYAACPFETTVAIISTTVEQAKKRIWKMVFQLYPVLRRIFKNSVMQMSPTPRIMSVLPDGRKDEGHGIFVIPVGKGELQKGINSLKGIHSRRVLLIGDEIDAEGMEPVVEVQDNLRAGTTEFEAIWLGNDPSLFNALGQIMQPTPGGMVTRAHTEWESISGVHCLRKDGFESPNIRDGDKWTGLMRQRDIDEIVRRNGGENTPGVYVMIRGLHPPEGVEDTVMSESLFLRFHCSESVIWSSSFIRSILLDPAFGGDRCVTRLMDRGLDKDGNMKVFFHPPIIIPIDASDAGNPPEYQIARAIMTLAQKESVPPEEFAMDGSGRSGAAVMRREWSPRIHVIEFGGECSMMPASDKDPRPAKEVYDRKVTELCYSFRQFVEADMIRGLDAKTCAEFSSRHFTIKGKKIAIETKREMKDRGLASPDFSDCASVGIHHIRERGINATIHSEVQNKADKSFDRAIKEMDVDSRQDCYAELF
jgi:hypothetical protein